MSRLDVSDEVRALVPAAMIERLIAMRNHTELGCPVCRQPITPEDPMPASVVVRVAHDPPVIQVTHAHCSPSYADYTTALARPTGNRMIYLPVVRGRTPSGVLIWEDHELTLDAESEESVDVALYRQYGFRSSEQGVMHTSGPVLPPGWVLRLQGHDLALHAPHGQLELFEDITATAPAGWLDDVRRLRRCLLVVGESLGLERPSVERIDALLADGRALAAVVQAKLR